MQTARADRDLVALGGRRMQQPGKPRQRDAEPATVGQIEGHAVLVEPDRLSFHQRTHPTPSLSPPAAVHPGASPSPGHAGASLPPRRIAPQAYATPGIGSAA